MPSCKLADFPRWGLAERERAGWGTGARSCPAAGAGAGAGWQPSPPGWVGSVPCSPWLQHQSIPCMPGQRAVASCALCAQCVDLQSSAEGPEISGGLGSVRTTPRFFGMVCPAQRFPELYEWAHTSAVPWRRVNSVRGCGSWRMLRPLGAGGAELGCGAGRGLAALVHQGMGCGDCFCAILG